MSQSNEVENRLKKRWRFLSKWSRKINVEYFRVYDRDIHQAPFIIDRIADGWIIWVCDNSFDDEELNAQIGEIKQILHDLEDGVFYFKDRRKSTDSNTGSTDDQELTIHEGGLKFKIKPTQYLDTGLFIDHRLLRAYIRNHSKKKRVLNLFAYTGSVSCYALDGGASFVKSVDISPVYSKWHHDNCTLNQFDESKYGIVTRDCRKFLWENKETFDLIFCDPPSFSQTKRNHLGYFQIQDHAGEIIDQCMNRLNEGGQLIFSTNYRKFKSEKAFDLNKYKVKELTNQLCSKDFEGKWASRCWEIRST